LILLVAERRKKTRATGDKGKTAKKTSRPRKGRSASGKTRDPARGGRGGQKGLTGPGGANGVSRPPAESVAVPIPEQEPAPSTLLPGELYLRAGRWWWRVKLPGEDRTRARLLDGLAERKKGHSASSVTPADEKDERVECPPCPSGEPGPEGTPDREGRAAAEKIAFAIWEQAVQENAARQMRLESTEKIERLKAQFLDKVRHFTELVETANAKLEAEAQARAEAEEKLRQLSARPRAAAPEPPALAGMPEDQKVGTDEGEKVRSEEGGSMSPTFSPSPAPTFLSGAPDHPAAPSPAPGLPLPVDNRPMLESPPPPAGNVPPGQCKTAIRPEAGTSEPPTPAPLPVAPLPVAPLPVAGLDSPAAPSPPPEAATPLPPVETGVCECCGAAGIARTHLSRIDSGQLLCPRCLAALRADIDRLEADPS